jgi:hypothetical protein
MENCGEIICERPRTPYGARIIVRPGDLRTCDGDWFEMGTKGIAVPFPRNGRKSSSQFKLGGLIVTFGDPAFGQASKRT